MNKFFKFFCVSLAVVLSTLSSGCFSPEFVDVTSLSRFNTDVHIEVYDKPLTDNVKNQIKTLLNDLDSELSLSAPSSKVNELNSAPAFERVRLSANAISIVNSAKTYYEYTARKFNFAVYPLVELWQFNAGVYPVENFTPPSPNDINAVKTLANPNAVIVEGNAVYKTEDGVKVDFGGIAKGFATDKIAEILKSAGHTSGYVNIGGSSLYILSLKGENNTFGIRHPRNKVKTILSFTKSQTVNVAVSTSGDYERYYEFNGKRYPHIIDGESGYAADTGIVSASILGGQSNFTDALTTALCLTEYYPDQTVSPLTEFISKVLSDYPTLKFFVLYDKDGVKRLITNEKQGNYTLLDDEYSVVKI